MCVVLSAHAHAHKLARSLAHTINTVMEQKIIADGDHGKFALYDTMSVFSPRIIQGMTGGRVLGVVCGHIKAFGLTPKKNLC